jgi:hypothetical protein
VYGAEECPDPSVVTPLVMWKDHQEAIPIGG